MTYRVGSLIRTVASVGVAYVANHWRGHAVDMQDRAHYGDVSSDVADELRQRVDHALGHGIAPERLIVDPGIGYAKTAEQNWALLADLDPVIAMGYPVLVGASRKGFLGQLLPGPDGEPRPASHRDDATTALTVFLATCGVWAIRTHTAAPHRDAIAVALKTTAR